VITADDVEFHEWPEGDHTFAETNWFAFYVPEAKINTIVYTVARKALNVQSSDISMYGALVDNRAESLYLDSQMALPAPASLADYTTANGLSIKAVNPPATTASITSATTTARSTWISRGSWSPSTPQIPTTVRVPSRMRPRTWPEPGWARRIKATSSSPGTSPVP
jgi:hypothetical protein